MDETYRTSRTAECQSSANSRSQRILRLQNIWLLHCLGIDQPFLPVIWIESQLVWMQRSLQENDFQPRNVCRETRLLPFLMHTSNGVTCSSTSLPELIKRLPVDSSKTKCDLRCLSDTAPGLSMRRVQVHALHTKSLLTRILCENSGSCWRPKGIDRCQNFSMLIF